MRSKGQRVVEALMPCSRVKLADGMVAIVCGKMRRLPKCRFCGEPSTKLCDKILATTIAGAELTCDNPICGGCASSVGPDKDFCPRHS